MVENPEAQFLCQVLFHRCSWKAGTVFSVFCGECIYSLFIEVHLSLPRHCKIFLFKASIYTPTSSHPFEPSLLHPVVCKALHDLFYPALSVLLFQPFSKIPKCAPYPSLQGHELATPELSLSASSGSIYLSDFSLP